VLGQLGDEELMRLIKLFFNFNLSAFLRNSVCSGQMDFLEVHPEFGAVFEGAGDFGF